MAVEELGIDPERIEVIVDTTRELGAGQTTGSRGTLMGAGSVQEACLKALAGGCEIGVDYEGEYRIDWTNSLSDGVENPVIHSTFGYAAQLVVLDPETGLVENVVAAHDVGRAVNPLLCEGQIEGSVHMGLGYALTEGFPCDEVGMPSNMTLRSLGIIRPKDMPPVDVILVESPEPNSPYGIKGVGEIGLVSDGGRGRHSDAQPRRRMANRTALCRLTPTASAHWRGSNERSQSRPDTRAGLRASSPVFGSRSRHASTAAHTRIVLGHIGTGLVAP